jgi:hypothetical protein
MLSSFYVVQVEKLAATIAELQSKAASAIEFQTEAGKGSLQQLVDRQAEYSKGAADSAAAAVSQAEETIAALSMSLQAQRGELQVFAEKQVSATEASLAATNELIDNTSTAIQSIHNTASDAQ